MTERKKRVFISCGQFLESEKALGKKAAELVNKLTPFEGYFAQNQNDLKGVAESILNRLHDSVGFIAIMHHRGTVTKLDKTITRRASVWIEQEIAIAAFMELVLKRPLRTVGYYQQGIELEGIRQFIHFNPKPFGTDEDVLADLEAVLPAWTTPLYDSLTAEEREGIRRKLALGRIHALHPQFTISLTNRSALGISVKSASLWHGQKRLSSATPSGGRKSVEVRADTENTAIAFVTDEDPALKLQSLGVVARHLPTYTFIEPVDIEVRIEYEALGVEDEYREIVGATVRGNRTIESL
jgi:hypothetical protein